MAVILRRKPSRLWHVMLWQTDRDRVEHGSWFRGKLYAGRCDLSPDGAWMVYLAMGDRGQTWNGLCRPPRLKAVYHSANMGSWNGGGFFMPDGRLICNAWFGEIESDVGPNTRVGAPDLVHEFPEGFRLGNNEDLGNIFPRLKRDGFEYDRPANSTGEKGTWWKKPTPRHAALGVAYAGYRNGYKFRFELEGRPEVMDPAPDWACWDSRGHLLVARLGRVERWSLRDIKRGEAGFVRDFEALEPPVREGRDEGGGE